MTKDDIEKWKKDHVDDPREVAFWEAYEKDQHDKVKHTAILMLVDELEIKKGD